MGIFPSSGSKRIRCTQDKQTGKLSCELYKKNKDGTEVLLASANAVIDGQCKPMLDNLDGSPEDLEELETNIMKRIQSQCTRRSNVASSPDDY